MTRSFFLAAVLLSLATAQDAPCFDPEFSGHLKTQTNLQNYSSDDLLAQLGSQRPIQQDIDLRLNQAIYYDAFDFEINAEYLGIASDGLEARRQLEQLAVPFLSISPSSFEERRLFDFNSQLNSDENHESWLRLDRLALGYSSDRLVFRVGRQAISWGNGLIFQVLDKFNPFSPIEIDKDYKSGDDMAYLQYLFDDGSDLQFLAIPRRDIDSGNVTDRQSSFAAKYHGRLDNLDYDLLIAQHYDQSVLGLGFAHELFQGLLRTDLSVTDLESESYWSALVNYDRSWELFDKNCYGYLEYFYNQIGSSGADYSSPSDQLIQRIEIGEIFTIARHYFASGLRVELTPLVNLLPSNIINLRDQSGIFQAGLQWDVAQNFTVLSGANIFYGPRHTEFGGLQTELGNFVAAPSSAYVRLQYFF